MATSASEIVLNIAPLAISVCCILWLVKGALQHKRRLPLPPGPTGLPLIGNAHQLPKSFLWKTYYEWSRKYGPIFHLRMFTNHLIILNSPESIDELLQKRSNIYSDRPQPYMHNEIVGRKYVVFNTSSENERFRKYRKILREELDSRASKNYGPMMEEETLSLLRGLRSNPENFLKLIRMNAVSFILKLSYGYTLQSEDDFFLGTIENAARIFAQTSRPGSWIVDYFPILRFIPSWLPLPGGNFKKLGMKYRDEVEGLRNVPHTWVKEQMKTDNYIPSFSSRYLASDDSHLLTEKEEDIVKNLASAIYLGGGDTTVSALSTFFLAMTLHPAVQKRAQQEIDEIIGRNRLPNIDDFQKGEMKYINAIIREVLRWGVVGPVGLPHRVTCEDSYMGYRIPKHATVVANIWAVMRDERFFPEPDEFKPERHLGREHLRSDTGGDSNSIWHEEYLDPMNYAFGFGRRICPGLYFSHLSLFLSFTSILQVFNITKELCEDGTEVGPVVEFTSGITSHPKPFKCTISLRNDAESLIGGG